MYRASFSVQVCGYKISKTAYICIYFLVHTSVPPFFSPLGHSFKNKSVGDVKVEGDLPDDKSVGDVKVEGLKTKLIINMQMKYL